MPECDIHAFKDVLNNASVFDTKKGVASNEVIYTTLQLSMSVYLPFTDEPLKEWWTCLGVRDIEFITTEDENEAVLMRIDDAILIVVQGSTPGKSFPETGLQS
jgi:hypothetical protein